MRIIGGHNTDYQQVNAINGIMSPEFASRSMPLMVLCPPNSPNSPNSARIPRQWGGDFRLFTRSSILKMQR